jgi:hypothetical protein
MPTGYHIERHAPQGPRTTCDVLVTEDQPNNQRGVLVSSLSVRR